MLVSFAHIFLDDSVLHLEPFVADPEIAVPLLARWGGLTFDSASVKGEKRFNGLIFFLL